MPVRLIAAALVAASSAACSEWEVNAPPITSCIDELGAGHSVVQCKGFAYDINVPPGCNEGGCGLIVDVHGATMTAQQEENNSSMRMLGEANGYIVVQPNAPSGALGTRFYLGDGDKIVAFTREVIERTSADKDRVHMMGFSNGGQTTWEVYCTGEDLFASIAPAAAARGDACEVLFGAVEIGGCLPTDEGKVTAPGVDILYMAGRVDNLVDYSCSETQRDSVVAAIGAGAPQSVRQSELVDWQRYVGADGTTFELISHDYTTANIVLGGHCYPGSTDLGEEPGQLFSFACEGDSEFHWGQAALEFFKQHPREGAAE